MLVLRSKYIAGILLAVFLWAACAFNFLGMYDARAAMAGIAPVSRGNGNRPNVSLMFNIDWGEEYVPAVLDILKEKGVHATFFPTGAWAEKNAPLMSRILQEGHEIGNHGGAHSHVETASKETLQRLIQSGEERILLAAGARPAKLFAPPYGEWNSDTVSYAAEIGYQTILWTVDTVDWRRPAPESIWKRALAGVESGAFVLLHPTEPTVAALPVLIDGVRAKGFTLTTVTENMLGR